MKSILSTFHRLLPCAILLCLLFVNSVVHAQKMTVAFINPTSPDEPFWKMLTGFMASAADDLDIRLDVHYAGSNRVQSLDIAKKILESDNTPDYLIFNFQAQTGELILALAEKANVRSFSINTDVPEKEKEKIGMPRAKFKHWLGHMSPNDFQAGYDLAEALVKQTLVQKQRVKDGKIHIIGLTGTADNTASVNRNKGLEAFASTQDDIVLHQIVNAVWDRQKAKDITEVLLQRYTDIDIIWAASDLMSLGAIEATKLKNKRMNVDMLSGGIDGTQEALFSMIDGDMYASMTGHFVEGGWALVLLNDHYHGIDFASELGVTIYSDMTLVTQENAPMHLAKYDEGFFDQIDFKQFSKVTNSKLEAYQFQLPSKLHKQ